MKEQFIPYNLALELKFLGFNERCIAYYLTHGNNTLMPMSTNGMEFLLHDNTKSYCSAPLWQQAFDWFREKHKLLSYIDTYQMNKWCFHYGKNIASKQSEKIVEVGRFDLEDYDTYEEARQSCLEKLIEICKNKE